MLFAKKLYNVGMNKTDLPARERSFGAGLAYTLSAVFPYLLMLIAQLILMPLGADSESNVYKYVSLLVPQVGMAAVSLIFLRRTKTPAREIYHPCKWYYFVIALALAFGLFAFSELNNLFIGLFEAAGYESVGMSSLPALTGWYLLPALLIIALLPAIFEETVFRGIQTGVLAREGWNPAALVFLSGALFSLFHGNPEQTVYQFLCGVAYAVLALRSGSVFPTMLAHFANNAVILILASFGINDFPAAAKPYIYCAAAAVLAAVLVFLVFLDKNYRYTRRDHAKKHYFLGAGVGILFCAVEWVTVLVRGFL